MTRKNLHDRKTGINSALSKKTSLPVVEEFDIIIRYMRSRKRIAIIVDYIETEYTQRAVAGASEFLKKQNAELVVFTIGTINSINLNYEYQQLATASHVNLSNVDGMIFLTCTQLNHVSLEYLRSYLNSFAPLPVVSVGCHLDGIPSITFSCKKSVKKLVDHIIKKHKRRNFALISLEGASQEAKEREESFREALKENNIEFDESKKIYGGFTYETAAAAFQEYMEKKGSFDFDAVVALNDEMAFACLDILKMNNIRVPQDIIVTGFDDEIRASCVTPTLSSINQDVESQTYAAAKMLYSIITGGEIFTNQTIYSYPIFRQSCGCIPLKNKSGIGLDAKGNKTEPVVQNIMDFGLKKWYANRNQFIQIIQHYSMLQTEVTLDELQKRINSDLISYGINAAAVCLFENPIATDRFYYFKFPERTRLFSAFDKSTNFVLRHNAKEILFDSKKQMLPEEIFSSMDGMYVCTLFNNSLIYGYIIFRPGDYDPSIYLIGCKIISSSIANATTFSFARNELKKLETDYNKIYTVSVTDELTGLLNRRGFVSIGSRMLENSIALDQCGLILFGDIDGLKKINDTHGHAAGDRAIKSESLLLKKTFRASDAIARLGGDEFAILAPGLTVEKFFELKKILKKHCDEYNENSNEPFTLSISIGYATFGGKHGYDINSLLEYADAALYEEKRKKYEGLEIKGSKMKIEPKFYAENNTLHFLNGTEVNISEIYNINADSGIASFNSDKGCFYSVSIPWTIIGTEEDGYNEEFLADLRDWLKALEEKNSFAIINPMADKPLENSQEKEKLTQSFKHCARRIKDCENMIGFVIPESADYDSFIKEISEKHSHYIFFCSIGKLLSSDEKIVDFHI